MSNSTRSERWSFSLRNVRDDGMIICPSGEGDRAAGLGLFQRSQRISQSWAAYSRSQQNRNRLQRWSEVVNEIQGQREHH